MSRYNTDLDYEYDYLNLITDVIVKGYSKPSRAGEIMSIPGMSIKIDLHQGFPMLTTRKMAVKGIFGELAAFIRGADKLATFKEFGCNYWDLNAKAWAPNKGLDEKDMRVGHIYGWLWRNWPTSASNTDCNLHGSERVEQSAECKLLSSNESKRQSNRNGKYDQLVELIKSIKTDPNGRRHILTAWNPAELADSCLPPCHVLAQFHCTGFVLHCTVYMRSVDLCLGLPSDVVLYALLTELIAKECGYSVGTLTFSFGDAHVYKNHIDNFMGVQSLRTPMALPSIELNYDTSLFSFTPEDVLIKKYAAHPAIAYRMNV
jgi:thymidylate synthase